MPRGKQAPPGKATARSTAPTAAGRAALIALATADPIRVEPQRAAGNPADADGDPAPSSAAPAGFLFIDTAISRIKERLAIPDGPAINRLLAAICAGELRTWRKRLLQPAKLQADYWEGADVDLERFRRDGIGGIRIRGKEYHLHRFLLAADDFDFWLSNLAPPAQTETETLPARAPDIGQTVDCLEFYDVSGESGADETRGAPNPSSRTKYPVNAPPTNAVMQAHEVFTWIAFRQAVPFEQYYCLYHLESDLWSGSRIDVVVWALAARAGLLDGGPCCGVCYPTRRDPEEIPSRFPVLTKQGPRILRKFRALCRQESGTLMTFADVARLYRDRLAHDRSARRQFEAAKRVLKDKLAGGLLTAYGLPIALDGKPMPGALVSPLSATLFMHPALTFRDWNEIRSDKPFPHDALNGVNIRGFASIQFQTKAVLEIWPPQDERSMRSIGVSGADAGGRAPVQRPDAASIWMLNHAQKCRSVGRKPTRDATIKLCQRQVGVKYRIAKAAWDALDPEWKNSRRSPIS